MIESSCLKEFWTVQMGKQFLQKAVFCVINRLV
jgi:hypothetical protein